VDGQFDAGAVEGSDFLEGEGPVCCGGIVVPAQDGAAAAGFADGGIERAVVEEPFADVVVLGEGGGAEGGFGVGVEGEEVEAAVGGEGGAGEEDDGLGAGGAAGPGAGGAQADGGAEALEGGGGEESGGVAGGEVGGGGIVAEDAGGAPVAEGGGDVEGLGDVAVAEFGNVGIGLVGVGGAEVAAEHEAVDVGGGAEPEAVFGFGESPDVGLVDLGDAGIAAGRRREGGIGRRGRSHGGDAGKAFVGFGFGEQFDFDVGGDGRELAAIHEDAEVGAVAPVGAQVVAGEGGA